MRFQCEKRAERDEQRGMHLWFAWFPVTVDDGSCRWLERVWRRRVFDRIGWPVGYETRWEYYA